MTDSPDREAIRTALEDAYRRKGDDTTNKYELYAYAQALPADTSEQVALSVAEAVLSDPPADQPRDGNTDTADPTPADTDAEDDSGRSDGLSEHTIADHYDRLGNLYAELGEADGGLCVGNTDFLGWYKTRSPADDTHRGEGRPWGLGREFAGMQDDLDRVLYATVNYIPSDWYLHAWEPYDYDSSGRSWAGGDNPMPGYGDLTAYAPFADIDLADDVKQRRPDGEIPKAKVETALKQYIDAFADLAGGEEHVFALDSVGGAYVMVAPTSTAPIAERYDQSDRALLFEDLTDRMNDWLNDTRENVNDSVDVAETFEADLVNNKNRLYKAPLSVHSSLPGVVTPVSTTEPEYDYTPLSAVDDHLLNDAQTWASEFTSDHSAAVSEIVETLWPSYADDADDWQAALDARLADLQAEQEASQQTEERLSDLDVPDDLDQTGEFDVIRKTIEDIDVAGLARQLADEWDTAPGRDPKRFDPPWRSSDSGTSCYADRDKFVDLEEGKSGGGALKLVARDRGIISDCRHKLDGKDFWKAMAELRKEGYEIPRYRGQDGTHPDNLGKYEDPDDKDEKRRQVLRALRASQRNE